MREKSKTDWRIDIDFSFGESFIDSGTLDRFQQLLLEYAPAWTAGLHIWRYREPKMILDLTSETALRDAVIKKGLERGPKFNELEHRFGSTIYSRQFGRCELRGASKSLILILSFDHYVLMRVGEAHNWGNYIAMQFLSRCFEGQTTKNWIDGFFDLACKELDPWHAHASSSNEWAENNLAYNTPDGARVRAVGIDKTKYLPGLYWQNYFGGPYVDLIGKEKLLSVPGCQVQAAGDGVLIKVFEDPHSWANSENRNLKRCVLTYLGEEFFFIKDSEHQFSRAPDFSLLGDKVAT